MKRIKTKIGLLMRVSLKNMWQIILNISKAKPKTSVVYLEEPVIMIPDKKTMESRSYSNEI